MSRTSLFWPGTIRYSTLSMSERMRCMLEFGKGSFERFNPRTALVVLACQFRRRIGIHPPAPAANGFEHRRFDAGIAQYFACACRTRDRMELLPPQPDLQDLPRYCLMLHSGQASLNLMPHSSSDLRCLCWKVLRSSLR